MAVSLAEWRWGSLICCVCVVLERQGPLRLYYKVSNMLKKLESDEKKLTAKQQQEGEDLIRRVHMVISDPWFWSYSKMLHQAGGIVVDLRTYLTICICHPFRYR